MYELRAGQRDMMMCNMVMCNYEVAVLVVTQNPTTPDVDD